MTPAERTTNFINGFLKNLINVYHRAQSYKKMFFNFAMQRSYEQNLQVLTTSIMEPAANQTREQIKRYIKHEAEYLTPGQRKKCQEKQIDPRYYVCAYEAANEKNRQNFHEIFGTDDFKEGNCTAIPMSILMKQKNNPLIGVFANRETYVNPIKLVEYLKKTQPNFVYETDEEHDFSQLFLEKNIGKGALVIISLERCFYNEQIQDKPQRPDGMTRGHMLVCTGFSKQSNGTVSPLYISFDDERLNYVLSSSRQRGYIIDLPRIIKCQYQEQEKLLLKRAKMKDWIK